MKSLEESLPGTCDKAPGKKMEMDRTHTEKWWSIAKHVTEEEDDPETAGKEIRRGKCGQRAPDSYRCGARLRIRGLESSKHSVLWTIICHYFPGHYTGRVDQAELACVADSRYQRDMNLQTLPILVISRPDIGLPILLHWTLKQWALVYLLFIYADHTCIHKQTAITWLPASW